MSAADVAAAKRKRTGQRDPPIAVETISHRKEHEPMKAYLMTEPGKGADAWKQVTRTDPVPSPGQVLIAVRAASLNYRDLMQAKGLYPGLPKREFIPLSDGAGEVVAVGEGVTQFHAGDRVAGNFFQNWVSGPVQTGGFRGSDLGGTLDGMLAEKVVLNASGVV